MTTLVIKGIKPRALNIAAIRQALMNEANLVANAIEDDFNKTVEHWTKKPEFEKIVDMGPPIAILVGTDNEVYGYVDKGTRPHKIYPRKAKALRFQSGYATKTIPGVIGSMAGGPFGDTVFSKGVNHPGTKARNFSKEIEKKWQKKFKRRMEKALSQARLASGHAL